MKAVVYRSYGGPEVLEVAEVDEPKVGPDWVKIAVEAASVNPVDWKVAAGGLDAVMDTYFPAIPGWDMAGTVEEVGPAVTTLAVGDEVFGYVRKDAVHGGTYAQKVAAPFRTVARKPSRLSFAESAALPLAGLTAYQGLVHILNVGDGDTVLIHAASGGVGSFAVQIAAARGARVIGAASAKNHEYLTSLGVEPVQYGDELVDEVRAIAPDGVHAVLDPIGGEALEQSKQVMAKSSRGRIVSIADPSVADIGGQYEFVHPDVADLQALATLVDGGALSVDIASSYSLDDVAEAWRESMEGHTRGKIVLNV